MAPIGASWATGSWDDNAWAAGTWAALNTGGDEVIAVETRQWIVPAFSRAWYATGVRAWWVMTCLASI